MFDKALTLKMIKNKFMTLFVSIAIGLGISLILLVLSMTGGEVVFLEGKFHISSQLLVLFTSVGVSLFVYLWIQAYTDYYDHFPMAVATGKTRRQFLVSMVLSSVLVTTAGVLVLVVLMNLLVGVSKEVWKPVFDEVMLQKLPVPWYQVNLMVWYTYMAFALSLTLLASLNYRFGAKIWLYLVGFIFIRAMLGEFLFEKSETSVYILPKLSLEHWFSKLLGEHMGSLMSHVIQNIVELVVVVIATLRMDQVDKEKLS